MSQPASVNVTGFSPSTTETELHDFFSFCGKVNSIQFKGDDEPHKIAVITFDKHSAAHTALMLNGGQLGGNTLTVASDVEHAPHHEAEEHRPHLEQSDKPRAGIAAEYLANGHELSENILKRAIDIDNKHGISKTFLSFMSGLDKSVGQRALGPDQTVSAKIQSTLTAAHTRVKSIDEKKGYSKIAQEYYSKALASPLGQSVLSFYTSTKKQVRDIHEEALRIRAAKAASTSASAPETTSAPVQPQPSK
ncbi:hypothetical protein V8E55_006420 [Tylopilus felleus]